MDSSHGYQGIGGVPPPMQRTLGAAIGTCQGGFGREPGKVVPAGDGLERRIGRSLRGGRSVSDDGSRSRRM